MNRIGFACKWIDNRDQVNGLRPGDAARELNTGTTTLSWLRRQTPEAARTRLQELLAWNAAATCRLLERVGSLPPQQRMVRLSSDLIPAYTAPEWVDFWKSAEMQAEAARLFGKIGDTARRLGIRISFHPGQFCVLASVAAEIVENSISEIEYHADMVRWMGYGQRFQDMKMNVHISGKRGPEGFREVLGRLSTEARNCLTVENEEMSWGLDACLSLADVVPTVLDVHHHWIREGEYISPNDERIARVLDSWRGVRPTMHYSVSREDVLAGADADSLPCMSTLLAAGYKKQKLRAHSDFYWNHAANQWALSFRDKFDIMAESKGKNLAVMELLSSQQQYQLHDSPERSAVQILAVDAEKVAA